MLRDVLRPPGTSPARLACGSALALLVACTEFEPGDDELEPTSVTLKQRMGPGNDWACLEEERAPPPLISSPVGAERLVQSLQLTLLVGGGVPSGANVRACAARDVDCIVPLTDSLSIDEQGWVHMPLYEGFDGYLEIRGDGLVPTMLFYADPLTVTVRVDGTPLGLVEAALLPQLSAATGTMQQTSLGLVYLRAFDCEHVTAPGVRFSIDQASASRWYFVGGLPSSMAEETEDTGLGGFINVTPGVAVVRAEVPGLPQPIAEAESVLVRAGWMTGIRFVPEQGQ